MFKECLIPRHALGTNIVLIETMCIDLDPNPYLKGQGHTRSNNLYSPIFPFLTNGSVQFWSSSTYQSGWEIKQNVYKKTMAGDIAILWTALFYFETIGQLQNPLHYKAWPLCQTTESSQPFWLCHSFYYSRDISPVNTLG